MSIDTEKVNDSIDQKLTFYKLKEWISSRIDGGCKSLSQGSDCICPLCNLDKIYDVLQWYATEANAINKNMIAAKDFALLASMNVLGLDGGTRAINLGVKIY